MESHRKFHINPECKKDKRTSGKYETTEEFLARGGEIDILACPLDNDIPLKVRHGEGRPI